MTGWAAASAAVAVAAALWVVHPDDRWVLARRLGGTEPAWARGRRAAVVAAVLVLVVAVSPATRLAVIAAAGAAWFGLRLHRTSAARAAARDFSVEVARVVRALSSELRAGISPVVAVQAVATDASDAWRPLRRVGARDVPGTLRRLSERPGGSGLVDVAAAWEIADRTGAPLAGILDRVADGVQNDVDIDREVATEAAPARATGRLMASLPVVGLLLGTTMGADPVRVLLGTAPGLACLVAGLTLACAGLWWIDRIVRTLEQR